MIATRPIDVACPTCAAQPGEVCVTQLVFPSRVMNIPHPTRIEAFITSLANRAADPADTLPVTDDVIERTGLI